MTLIDKKPEETLRVSLGKLWKYFESRVYDYERVLL
jgi:hypothetical protein